ncbi:universal stress protein [Mycobacterium sp. THU-M104]|uniref:universal stress protein n=1 Tax=Mycobacterium sp. THU-M104 TaxID=3410515 RepID=UPI003B9A407C
MFDSYSPKSVVVGIDGSQAAIRAACWAVDEVAGTDVPLRLLHVARTDPGAGPLEARVALAAAEEVVHEAYSAVEALGRPVKVQTEVLDGEPVPTLVAASRSTGLLCVGDTGAAQHPEGWLGSTARELAQSAHCSVVIVRGARHGVDATDRRWIVACVDGSPEDVDVLDLALDEAERRHARLRVVTEQEPGGAPGGSGGVLLDPHLVRCLDGHPDVHIDTAVLRGPFRDYLAEQAAFTQLVMVGAARTAEVRQLLGPDGAPALRGSDFSLLIVGPERPGR